MLVGAPFWGMFSDKMGRKSGFFCAVVLTAIFGLASGFSPSLGYLLVFRCIVGFGLSGSTVAFSLFAEFLPLSSRGISLTVLQGFWSIGSILEAALAWIIIPTIGWRWLVFVSALPLIGVIFFYPILPESPRFLLEQERRDKALEVLETVAEMNR